MKFSGFGVNFFSSFFRHGLPGKGCSVCANDSHGWPMHCAKLPDRMRMVTRGRMDGQKGGLLGGGIRLYRLDHMRRRFRMTRMKRLLTLFAGLGLAPLAWADTPFFDTEFAVHATPYDTGDGEVVPRGLLINIGEGYWLVYDQELLRPVAWLSHPKGQDPLELRTMAQISWNNATRKAGANHPVAEGKAIPLAPALPGVALTVEGVLEDPRPTYRHEAGRGGLEAFGRKFRGYHAGETAVLVYEIDGLSVREWHAANDQRLLRHLEVGPGPELVFMAAKSDDKSPAVSSNHPNLQVAQSDGVVLARLAASENPRRATLIYGESAADESTAETPPAPAPVAGKAPKEITTPIKSDEKSGPGWALDRIGLPGDEDWPRRVRPADIAFLSPERAALITFEGDVWMLDIGEDTVRWQRFGGGLCEPLSIGQVDGMVQVHTRNGLIRLHDRTGDGVADAYENFSSLWVQTASTRGFPLDMEIDSEGRTYISIGGIAMGAGPRGMNNNSPEEPHRGGILRISADGQELEVIASRAREPFIGLDPETDRLVMTDQEGNYVPSSGFFPVIKGTHFGFGGGELQEAAPWIPHAQDPSSSSPLWPRGSAFDAWDGGVLNFSYGNGRLFLGRMDGGWPATRGAVIPLGIETGLPILHGRQHPADGSVWLAGFRIYDSRVDKLQGLARLRATGEPLATPVDAAIFAQGVFLRFESEVEPDTLDAGKVSANEWQYKGGSGYGSARYQRDGSRGTDSLATGAVLPSRDGKAVFVHIPDLQPTMQLELIHPFRPTGIDAKPLPVYFSATELLPAPWIELGFDPPQLDDDIAAVREEAENAVVSVERGQEVAVRFGCVACHSIDGTLEGHSGPSWKGLYGSERIFRDGKSAVAGADYLRKAILEPEATTLEGYEQGMASYAGVIDDAGIESLILYIRSLK